MKPAPRISEMKKAPNPYLGPQPFAREDEYRFFGRKREMSDLYSLVAAHRTVLLYAQSGVGKSSLLNAGLIPRLVDPEFDVLPAARVSGTSLAAALRYNVENIYVFNFAETWAECAVNVNITLQEALAKRDRRVGKRGEPSTRVAIFDQFEELFTAYPERWRDRRNFLMQLGAAMEDDPSLRVLFAMREDFVAQIDPYERLLPEEFRTRYRLEQLGRDAALDAVKEPLKRTGIHFKAGVAEDLVDDLLKTAFSSPEYRPRRDSPLPPEEREDSTRTLGEFVEPVQLQVACFSLYRKLPPGTAEITKEHLTAFGDVDQALQEFYQEGLRLAAAKAKIKEDGLREWFEKELITEAGTRGLVFRGETEAGGIPNAAIDALDELHLIREEVRGGHRWYELSHDRFIQPILRANDAWRAGVEERERERRDEERRRLAFKKWLVRGLVAVIVVLAAVIALAGYAIRQQQAAEAARENSLKALAQANSSEAQLRQSEGISRALVQQATGKAVQYAGGQEHRAGGVTPSGQIFGTGKYEQLDPGWSSSLASFLEGVQAGSHPFVTRPRIIPIPDDVQIALAGDWGTGDWRRAANPAPSTKVGGHMALLHPDITIHLGGVYYAGTASEEQHNLVNLWPTGRLGSLALNSSYEMYSGGGSYFRAISAPSGPFAMQSGCSYFALENRNWIIVGLDSAHFASASNFYTDGSLGAEGNVQVKFLMSQVAKGKKVIVLTYHNGLSEDGSVRTSLWRQVMDAFPTGAGPAYWYWAHVHEAVVYSAQFNGTAKVLCRCLGNGGLPSGRASELQGKPQVAWYENRLAKDPDIPQRVLDGFVALQLDGPSLSEVFYDENGHVVWSK